MKITYFNLHLHGFILKGEEREREGDGGIESKREKYRHIVTQREREREREREEKERLHHLTTLNSLLNTLHLELILTIRQVKLYNLFLRVKLRNLR